MEGHRDHRDLASAVTAVHFHWVQHEKMPVNQAHSHREEVAFLVHTTDRDARSSGEPAPVVAVHVGQQMAADEVD